MKKTKTILDLLHSFRYGGFLLILPRANMANHAAWVPDGLLRAIISDRLRCRYQAPTGDVH